MPEIISARCFGCGNTIKVPAQLGGKKARCPQCTNTITIPMPNDSTYDEVVPDADLPEVAREGEVLKAEEGEAPIPEQEPEGTEESDTGSRRRGGTGVRRPGSSTSHPRLSPRSGAQPRYSGPAMGAPAAKSNTGVIVGVVLGVVAVIILAVAFASSSSNNSKTGEKKSSTREKDKEGTPKEKEVRNTAQYGPEDQALVNRLTDYTGVVNRGDPSLVMKFYTYEPDDERKVRLRATQITDAKTVYDNVQVKSVSASSGTITFSYGGGKEKTLQWKQVDGVWMIAEVPSP